MGPKLTSLAKTWVIFAFLGTTILGCNNNPPTAKVMGTVKLEGKPMTSGRVLFLPIGGGKQAIGKIEEDGRFELTTFKSGDGALVGRHHAVVLKAKAASSDATFSFERTDGDNLTVESNKTNEFTIDLETDSWLRMSGP